MFLISAIKFLKQFLQLQDSVALMVNRCWSNGQWHNKKNWPISKETNAIWFLCPMPQKAATLNQFTFTMSNYNYRTLSRRDTQLSNHYTLHMNSLAVKFRDYTSVLHCNVKTACSQATLYFITGIYGLGYQNKIQNISLRKWSHHKLACWNLNIRPGYSWFSIGL